MKKLWNEFPVREIRMVVMETNPRDEKASVQTQNNRIAIK